jgi:hypothetical protein
VASRAGHGTVRRRGDLAGGDEELARALERSRLLAEELDVTVAGHAALIAWRRLGVRAGCHGGEEVQY